MMSDGVVFGSATGSYILDAIPDDWQLFGPNTGYETNKTSPGDGWLGAGQIGYRWGQWDVAVDGQYVKLSEGDLSASGGLNNKLKARNWLAGIEIGFNDHIDSMAVRTSLGLRYAEWKSTAEALFSSNQIEHKWKGFGPRFTVAGSLPLDGALTLEGQAGIGALFGKLETNSTPGWICSACGDKHQASINVDGKLGLGWMFGSQAKLVVGYQAQYWSAVNVAVTDDSGVGLVTGKSDYLIHGPFVTVAFTF